MTAPASSSMNFQDPKGVSVDLEFTELHEGREDSFEVVVEDGTLDRFAELSGDVSPIHISRKAAEERGFVDRVGHGMLAGAYISRFIGTRLPGSRALLQSINLKFHRPFFPGDTLKVHGEIREVHESVRVVLIDVRITRADDLIASAKIQAGVAT